MRLLKLTLSILSISLFIACGGSSSKEESNSDEKTMTSKEIMQQRAKEKENSSTESTSEKEEATADKTSNEDVVEITIEGNDQMQFNLDEIKVKAGSTVKLTLKHVGEMSVTQMGHNWVLLKQGTDIMEFGQKAATAKERGYIPESEDDKVIVFTDILGGGEEDTIEFEAPAKGTYDFICSFPGHVSLMKGKFIVE